MEIVKRDGRFAVIKTCGNFCLVEVMNDKLEGIEDTALMDSAKELEPISGKFNKSVLQDRFKKHLGDFYWSYKDQLGIVALEDGVTVEIYKSTSAVGGKNCTPDRAELIVYVVIPDENSPTFNKSLKDAKLQLDYAVKVYKEGIAEAELESMKENLKVGDVVICKNAMGICVQKTDSGIVLCNNGVDNFAVGYSTLTKVIPV